MPQCELPTNKAVTLSASRKPVTDDAPCVRATYAEEVPGSETGHT